MRAGRLGGVIVSWGGVFTRRNNELVSFLLLRGLARVLPAHGCAGSGSWTNGGRSLIEGVFYAWSKIGSADNSETGAFHRPSVAVLRCQVMAAAVFGDLVQDHVRLHLPAFEHRTGGVN